MFFFSEHPVMKGRFVVVLYLKFQYTVHCLPKGEKEKEGKKRWFGRVSPFFNNMDSSISLQEQECLERSQISLLVYMFCSKVAEVLSAGKDYFFSLAYRSHLLPKILPLLQEVIESGRRLRFEQHGVK